MANIISYTTILAAKAGDGEAMSKILRHYASYIAGHAKRNFYDEYGNYCELVDEDIRQRIEAKLLYQIINKFDPSKLPDGEIVKRS